MRVGKAVRALWILAALWALGGFSGAAEGEAREFEAPEGSGTQEWRLRLAPLTPVAPLAPGALQVAPTGDAAELRALLEAPRAASVVSTRKASQPAALDRDRRLAEDQLVVASFDDSGVELAWRAVLDPRWIRAEIGRDGGLVGTRVVLGSAAEFVVALPDDARVRQLRVFRPRWNGSRFERVEIARLEVRR
jgi:hypothetical protein